MVATPRELKPTSSLGLDVTLPATGTARFQLDGLANLTRLDPGCWVGDYVISEVHSRGGFGTVYRAQHAPSATQVALKVLHGDLAVSPEMVRRFEREAITLNRIRHPNIVRVHDVGTLDDGRPYFTMEWLDGHTLEENLRMRGPFDVSEALPIVEDLCAALRAAHDVGIVHRDLKASNVMIVPVGEWFAVKLFDFGIAKLLDPEDGGNGITSTGNRLGTPHHMAPEQILGEPVDERTDVYALGVLMFQLLTGRFPFQGDNALEIEDMHLHAPPPRASEHAPVNAAVDEVILRCLAKDREDRFASMIVLIDELRAATSTDGRELEDWAQELRPSLRIRARRAPAIAIHVDVRGDGDRDAAATEDALDLIRAELKSHGLDIAEETSSTLLAAAPLPDDPRVAVTMRQRAIEKALSLSYRLPGAGGQALRLSFTVHTAPALMISLRGRREYIGGALMQVATWAMSPPEPGVVATEAALTDIADRFASEPLDTDRRSVLASV